MKLVLIGPPGVGKGTNARYLAQRLSIPHISVGDMFRQHVSEQTELGRRAQVYMDQGKLVPDEITVAMVKERLAQEDLKGGFLLDGFPRTIEQAKMLDKLSSINAVFALDAPAKQILERITGRRTCPECKAVYHVKYKPAKVEGKCDQCGAELIQRSDETPEAVRQRLIIYEDETTPLLDYYRNEDLLHEIDVSYNIPDEWDKITEQYDQVFKELGEE